MKLRFLLLTLLIPQSMHSMIVWQRLKAMTQTTSQTVYKYSDAVQDCYRNNPEGYKFIGMALALQAAACACQLNSFDFALSQTLLLGGSAATIILTAPREQENRKRSQDFALLLGAKHGSLSQMQNALARGARVNCTQRDDGKTPLCFILEQYAKAQEEHIPNSPLFSKSMNKYEQIAEFLKSKGANLNQAVAYFIKPERRDYNPEIAIEWLEKNGATDFYPLHYFAQK